MNEVTFEEATGCFFDTETTTDTEHSLSSLEETATIGEIKKIILQNMPVQKALLEHIVIAEDLKSKSPDSQTSVNFEFYEEPEKMDRLLETLKYVYKGIYPIKGKDGRIAGYHVSNASETAVRAARELYAGGELNGDLTHFLPIDKEGVRFKKRAVLVARSEEPKAPDEKLGESPFHIELLKDIKRCGAGHFLIKGVSFEDLENDPRIQELFALCNKIYFYAYDDEDYCSVLTAM